MRASLLAREQTVIASSRYLNRLPRQLGFASLRAMSDAKSILLGAR